MHGLHNYRSYPSTMLSLKHFSLSLLLTISATASLPTLADQARPPARETIPATTTYTSEELGKAIDAQIDEPRFSSASWGISVVSLDTGRTLYAHAADRLLQPASTAKLYTAALVLDSIGPDYRIPTQVLITDAIRHGRLNGPLILRGMGDPTLDTPGTHTDWADQLALQLVADGIRDVHGDLIADDTYFSGPSAGAGWEARDLQSGFAAPASALSINENKVVVTTIPGKAPGYPARLTLDPAGALPHVVNHLMTAAGGTRSDINLYRAPGDDTLYAFGSMPADASSHDFKLAMPDPAWYAGMLLRGALARHGIHLHGDLRIQRWPQQNLENLDKSMVAAQILSPPLIEILSRGLKCSKNLYLQNLLQIAGTKAYADAARAGDPAEGFLSTEAWGIRALRQLLDHIGIPPTAAQLEDGAGLSRQDLATPDATVRLLTYMSHQPYAEQLRDALPIAGVDGTLEWRMRNTVAMDNAHAKTGSMTDVRCLAGYVTTASGERLAFTIMLNNAVQQKDEPSPNRNLDAIVELLAAFAGHS